MNLNFQRLRAADANRIHAQLMRLGWTRIELHRRTGIDRAKIQSFFEHKRASVKIGARIAIAVAAGLIERGPFLDS